MRTISVLEKFDSVEITNESRITTEELAFCTAQQALYEKVIAQHRNAFAALQTLRVECETFMKSIADDNNYDSYGYTYLRYSLDYGKTSKADFAQKTIRRIHDTFISTIMDYFKKKYNVLIQPPEYERLLELKEPELPIRTFDGFGSWNEEEKAKYKAERHAYEEAVESYLDAIISKKIDFNSILDHIFFELDGSTFTELLEQEITDASRNATQARGHNPKYEIKNKKITMNIICPRKGWRDEYEVDLSGEGYRAILRALTYFDSDKRVNGIYPGWDRFVCYRMKASEGIFDTHEVGGNKVHAFKYFKNGKFVVSFNSHVAARQFASEFLHGNAEGADE